MNKITEIASHSILEVIESFVAGSIIPIAQDHKMATYTKIIKKHDTYLNFNESAENILGKIRAFNPNPGTKCFINGELVKIIKAKKEYLEKIKISQE